jgi:hypothetical protein
MTIASKAMIAPMRLSIGRNTCHKTKNQVDLHNSKRKINNKVDGVSDQKNTQSNEVFFTFPRVWINGKFGRYGVIIFDKVNNVLEICLSSRYDRDGNMIADALVIIVFKSDKGEEEKVKKFWYQKHG